MDWRKSCARVPTAGIFAGVVLVMSAGLGTSARPAGAEDKPVEQTVGAGGADERLQRLVEQLGHDQFATREKAQGQLERLGLLAFDALQTAQHHDDVEIAMRARYLLRVMPISWSREGDSPEVRNILKGYGEQNEDERRSRMDRLSGMMSLPGAVALCRLARFETSNQLSKRAALLAIAAPPPEAESARNELIAAISSVVGASRRPASQWLKAFAQTLSAPETSLAEWQRLTQAEFDLFRQSPEQTSPEMLRDLLRWHVDLLLRVRRSDDATVVVRRALTLLEGDEEEIVETVDWLLERKYWPQVAELAKRFHDTFRESTVLAYRLAESQRRQGNEKAAQEAADLAFKIELDSAEKNLHAGLDLEDRGMFDWAERELRHAMKVVPMEAADHVRARFRLSEMFHDMGQDLAAAHVLQELIDALKKDPNLEQRIEAAGIRDPNAFRARMHYFYARHAFDKNDLDAHRAELEKALDADEHDADVLIAMHRVPNPTDAWRDQTRKRIWEASRKFHDDVDKFERVANEADDRLRNDVAGWLAMFCNQYAWLVANTEGDYDEALRCSHRSLEMRPGEAGYMDTLGRCYFAKKDYENAVKYQAMAAKRKPHSGQIVRQLELFEKRLADSRKSAAAAPMAAPMAAPVEGRIDANADAGNRAR